MKIYEFEQGTDEWLNIRLGKLTGSNFHIFLGNSKARQTEIYKRASERLTNNRCDQDNFKNIHTERGRENESYALETYSFETNNQVKTVGFIELDEWTGCSPDGLVGDDGIIEIKSPDNHTYLHYVDKEYLKPEYKTQIQFNLYVSGRKWCDFIYYNPNFQNGFKIIRVKRDEEKINEIKFALENSKKEITDIVIKNSKLENE